MGGGGLTCCRSHGRRSIKDYIRKEANFHTVFSSSIPGGVNVSWHISRFFPAYQMKDIPATPGGTFLSTNRIDLKAGLNYVYLGNVESSGEIDTKCPRCGHGLIERSYFGIVKNTIQEHCCPNCGREIAGVGL